MDEKEKADFTRRLEKLTDEQFSHIRAILRKLETPIVAKFLTGNGTALNQDVVTRMGVRLLSHHANSSKPMAKVLVEYALNDSFREAGIESELHTSGTNPGWDLKVVGTTIALKTQADSVKLDSIHISKWMELGSGDWVPQTQHERFLSHLERYEKIWVFRCTSKSAPTKYELVEIPKTLFTAHPAPTFSIVAGKSKARIESPSATSRIADASGKAVYDLYHDGGEEKKLTIRGLDKSKCVLLATWEF